MGAIMRYLVTLTSLLLGLAIVFWAPVATAHCPHSNPPNDEHCPGEPPAESAHDLILDKLDEILEGQANDPPAPVPQTGQTECWDGNVVPVIIPCGGIGHDGYLRKGVKAPSPRFTDNGDGTVADNLTGLIWLQTANCSDLNPNQWNLVFRS